MVDGFIQRKPKALKPDKRVLPRKPKKFKKPRYYKKKLRQFRKGVF